MYLPQVGCRLLQKEIPSLFATTRGLLEITNHYDQLLMILLSKIRMPGIRKGITREALLLTGIK